MTFSSDGKSFLTVNDALIAAAIGIVAAFVYGFLCGWLFRFYGGFP